MKARLLPLALVALAFAVGCGGGDSTGSSASDAKEPLYPWLKGPTREFLVRDGDNVVQTYGHEATAAEREDVSDIVEAWMRAREGHREAQECRYLDPVNVKSLLESASNITQRKVSSCAVALTVLGETGNRASRANNMTGPIDSLRLGQGRGYAQYHGDDGRDWIVPVRSVGGEWKISTLAPLDRMK